ncbi:hypothetical protein LWI29_032221 [Acer saccharum]|uniref:Retrotransposon Copia-like N-terminal domain-containing protein n=1 Tax=Acer saccharum TaxID=4024 RepID=A0AA39T6X3_ACESA|nr:hypothetical protein LWI29_030735 [Acer saccharum]KAK0602312.1 hypothetical protein LWI29_032221 [Acer saccharum]
MAIENSWKLDVSQPIQIILDGPNYVLWAQAMQSFLKGRKLWRYVTGDITMPTLAKSETDDTKDITTPTLATSETDDKYKE